DAEPSSGINVASISASLSGGGSVTSSGYDPGTGLVTLELTGLDEGSNTITLNVSDVAGNGPTTEALNFNVDTMPPVIDDLSWSIPEGDWIGVDNATLTVTVTDSGIGVDLSSAVVGDSGTGTVGILAYDSVTHVLSIPLSDLGEGEHTITLDIDDAVGNHAVQQSVTFGVDLTDPVIDETTWAGPWAHEPGHWTNNASPTITVNAYDPGFGVLPPTGSGIDASTASATLTLNGGSILLPGTVNYASGVITVALSGLADGEYGLEVEIDDNVGHSATPKSVVFHVDVTGPAFANPYPANQYETNNRGLAPHIDITDAGGAGVDPDSIAWTMTRQSVPVVGTLTPPWDGLTSTFTADADLASDGYYDLAVSANDLVGNPSSYPPATWFFLLDTTKPELDSVVLDLYRRIPDVAGGVIYTPLKKPEIRVDFHDPALGSGFNGAVCDTPGTFDVYVYADADMTVPVDGTLDRDATPSNNSAPWGGKWVPTPNLPDGDYFVKVVITDDAGNIRNPE
ncbi:MAG TPA: hypothetical protein DDZ84_07245, partial [Firmicutes bacterium]|nr:hypothetical protein [Bacillota bacterium]